MYRESRQVPHSFPSLSLPQQLRLVLRSQRKHLLLQLLRSGFIRLWRSLGPRRNSHPHLLKESLQTRRRTHAEHSRSALRYVGKRVRSVRWNVYCLACLRRHLLPAKRKLQLSLQQRKRLLKIVTMRRSPAPGEICRSIRQYRPAVSSPRTRMVYVPPATPQCGGSSTLRVTNDLLGSSAGIPLRGSVVFVIANLLTRRCRVDQPSPRSGYGWRHSMLLRALLCNPR